MEPVSGSSEPNSASTEFSKAKHLQSTCILRNFVYHTTYMICKSRPDPPRCAVDDERARQGGLYKESCDQPRQNVPTAKLNVRPSICPVSWLPRRNPCTMHMHINDRTYIHTAMHCKSGSLILLLPPSGTSGLLSEISEASFATNKATI